MSDKEFHINHAIWLKKFWNNSKDSGLNKDRLIEKAERDIDYLTELVRNLTSDKEGRSVFYRTDSPLQGSLI